jgi:hypothetical protein
LLILGVTVKVTPLLATPPTVTTTLPVLPPLGTATARLVLLQLVGVAAAPLKLTVLAPWVLPKFVPAIVTAVPTAPVVGERLLMAGVVCARTVSPASRINPMTVPLPKKCDRLAAPSHRRRRSQEDIPFIGPPAPAPALAWTQHASAQPAQLRSNDLRD